MILNDLLLELGKIRYQTDRGIYHKGPEKDTDRQEVTVGKDVVPKKRVKLEITEEHDPEQNEKGQLDKLEELEIMIMIIVHDKMSFQLYEYLYILPHI